MNNKQAREKGYAHTGNYSHSKEEMKTRAAELRAAGNKAVVVDCPPSPYSRGHSGMGYNVYWIESTANKAERLRAAARLKSEQLEAERKRLQARITEIDDELLILFAEELQ